MKQTHKFPVCPTCFAKNINHRTFTSTRVADYANKRFIRYFRCGPLEKNPSHEEHEWPVEDYQPKKETYMIWPELGDEMGPIDGTPLVHVKQEESKPSV